MDPAQVANLRLPESGFEHPGLQVCGALSLDKLPRERSTWWLFLRSDARGNGRQVDPVLTPGRARATRKET